MLGNDGCRWHHREGPRGSGRLLLDLLTTIRDPLENMYKGASNQHHVKLITLTRWCIEIVHKKTLGMCHGSSTGMS